MKPICATQSNGVHSYFPSAIKTASGWLVSKSAGVLTHSCPRFFFFLPGQPQRVKLGLKKKKKNKEQKKTKKKKKKPKKKLSTVHGHIMTRQFIRGLASKFHRQSSFTYFIFHTFENLQGTFIIISPSQSLSFTVVLHNEDTNTLSACHS